MSANGQHRFAPILTDERPDLDGDPNLSSVARYSPTQTSAHVRSARLQPPAVGSQQASGPDATSANNSYVGFGEADQSQSGEGDPGGAHSMGGLSLSTIEDAALLFGLYDSSFRDDFVGMVGVGALGADDSMPDAGGMRSDIDEAAEMLTTLLHYRRQPEEQLQQPQQQQQQSIGSQLWPLLAAVNDITAREMLLQQSQQRSPIADSSSLGNYASHFVGTHSASDCMLATGQPAAEPVAELIAAMPAVSESLQSHRSHFPDLHLPVTESVTANALCHDEYDDGDDELTVADSSVPTRAWATLPHSYLRIGQLPPLSASGACEYSVFATTTIPLRTKFGPVEGNLRYLLPAEMELIKSDSHRRLPALFVRDTQLLDVSNENTSNWMRFVRLAHTADEQNLLIRESRDNRLYFRTIRRIDPQQELRIGYAAAYAQRYALPFLDPQPILPAIPTLELHPIAIRPPSASPLHTDLPPLILSGSAKPAALAICDTWPCMECCAKFDTFTQLQLHLNTAHDEITGTNFPDRLLQRRGGNRPRRRRMHRRVVAAGGAAVRYDCLDCSRVFRKYAALIRHCDREHGNDGAWLEQGRDEGAEAEESTADESVDEEAEAEDADVSMDVNELVDGYKFDNDFSQFLERLADSPLAPAESAVGGDLHEIPSETLQEVFNGAQADNPTRLESPSRFLNDNLNSASADNPCNDTADLTDLLDAIQMETESRLESETDSFMKNHASNYLSAIQTVETGDHLESMSQLLDVSQMETSADTAQPREDSIDMCSRSTEFPMDTNNENMNSSLGIVLAETPSESEVIAADADNNLNENTITNASTNAWTSELTGNDTCIHDPTDNIDPPMEISSGTIGHTLEIQTDAEFNVPANTIETNGYTTTNPTSTDTIASPKPARRIRLTSALHKCTACRRYFASAEQLAKHLSHHQPTVQCPQCPRLLLTTSALANHLLKHRQSAAEAESHSPLVRAARFQCIYCAQPAANAAALNCHVAAQHSIAASDGDAAQFACPQCRRLFHSYANVRKHVRAVHPAAAHHHQCPDCPERTFKEAHRLLEHRRRVHDGVAPAIECAASGCARRFRRQDKMLQHFREWHEAREVEGGEEVVELSKRKPGRPRRPRDWELRPPERADSAPTASQHYAQLVGQLTAADLVEEQPIEVPPIAKSPTPPTAGRYQCPDCRTPAFQRRGMLVNHMVRAHPGCRLEAVPALRAPIVRQHFEFKCWCCDRVYGSRAKRRLHMLKHHPHQQLDIPSEVADENSYSERSAAAGEEERFTRAVGTVQAEAVACGWCPRQYATRQRLLRHQRTAHPDEVRAAMMRQFAIDVDAGS